MQIPIFQVDAFTSRPFAGNPAAVCPLEAWLPDEQLQAIAAENNLSETAFYVGAGDRFELRWFTPAVEVDLCGHATLAAASVIFSSGGRPDDSAIAFDTKSGELLVRRHGELYTLDFPARPPGPCEIHPRLMEALDDVPQEILAARDYLVVYRTEKEVRGVRPDMAKLSTLDRFAVIITAPGDGVDFVSRFFAPAKGVPEDPVTGSSHCTLIPYWARRFGKSRLHALQVSPRGGELWCELRGDRVSIAGNAVRFLEGTIHV